VRLITRGILAYLACFSFNKYGWAAWVISKAQESDSSH
jgi:hypothetical protein